MPTYNGERFESTDYRDDSTLRYLYWSEDLSTYDIADIFDISYQTVYDWLQKTGVGTRTHADAISVEYANYRTQAKDGYEVWDCNSGSTVRVHQLLAISDGHSPYEVFDDENHVHHKNGIEWDNRPENITVVDRVEHRKIHQTGSDHWQTELTEDDVREIKRLLSETDLYQRQIAEKYDTSRSVVKNIHLGNTWSHVEGPSGESN